MVEERTEDVALAQADASMLALLARGFLRPVAEFSASIQDGSYVASLRELLDAASNPLIAQALDDIAALSERLAGMDAEAARLELEVDYNRLFVGPGKLLAPPYESFYRSEPDENGRGTICGVPMLAVKDVYQRFNVELPDHFVDYPDHVAFELEFLSLLATREAEALESGDEEALAAFRSGQEMFRTQHLGVWFAQFAENVKQGAQTELYPALASLVLVTQL